MAGVATGKAASAAEALAAETDETRNAIWAHLDPPTQQMLCDAWPKEVAA